MEYVFENKHTWRKHTINSACISFDLFEQYQVKYSGKNTL